MRTELKKLRVGLHLTQAEFAKACGVSRATYAFIERGERSGNAEFWAAVQRVGEVSDANMYKLQKLDKEGKKKVCE